MLDDFKPDLEPKVFNCNNDDEYENYFRNIYKVESFEQLVPRELILSEKDQWVNNPYCLRSLFKTIDPDMRRSPTSDADHKQKTEKIV